MTKHRVKVIQVFQVEMETVVEVEAATYDQAFDMVTEGEVELPPSEDSVWTLRSKSLENEEYEAA